MIIYLDLHYSQRMPNEIEQLANVLEEAATIENIYGLAKGRDLTAAEAKLLGQSLDQIADTTSTLIAYIPMPAIFKTMASTISTATTRVAKKATEGAIRSVFQGGFLAPGSKIASNAATGAAFEGSKELAEITQARQEIKDSISAVEIIYQAAVNGKPITAADRVVLQQNLENIRHGADTIRAHMPSSSRYGL